MIDRIEHPFTHSKDTYEDNEKEITPSVASLLLHQIC